MNLFKTYRNGNLKEVLEKMETKEIAKCFRAYCFGIPSKNREKLITDFISRMEKEWNKGNSFMRG